MKFSLLQKFHFHVFSHILSLNFHRFGIVERVKILHNKRTAALVQMQTPDQAQMAVHEQDVLKRTGADIYVNFSTKVPFVRLPSEMGVPEDGLSKDFTMIANGPSKILLLHYSQCGNDRIFCHSDFT